MGYQEELTRLQEAKASMRQSIIDKGVEVPEDAKIESFPEYIAQIVGGGGGYDPNNPTLEGLKAAVDAGDYDAFPAGTEIPDTYAGNSNPLIVAQYLNSSNNSTYGGAVGVILVRKYVEPLNQQYGSTLSVNYNASLVKQFLDTTYLSNCSDELKSIISNINVPFYNGSSISNVDALWFLMSDTEVYSNLVTAADGIAWDYWKQKTGLSSPSSAANTGRIANDRSGNAQYYWLRSKVTYVCRLTTGGAVFQNGNSGIATGVLPACFIAKD